MSISFYWHLPPKMADYVTAGPKHFTGVKLLKQMFNGCGCLIVTFGKKTTIKHSKASAAKVTHNFMGLLNGNWRPTVEEAKVAPSFKNSWLSVVGILWSHLKLHKYTHRWSTFLDMKIKVKVNMTLRTLEGATCKCMVKAGTVITVKIEWRVYYRVNLPSARLWINVGTIVFLQEGKFLTRDLFRRVNHKGTIHASPEEIQDKFIIEFVVTSWSTTKDDIREAWDIISETTTILLAERPSLKHVDQLESLTDSPVVTTGSPDPNLLILILSHDQLCCMSTWQQKQGWITTTDLL